MPPVAPPVLHLQPNDLILSDFDGTISLIDTGLAMMETLPPRENELAWEIEYAWRRGEIDSMEGLREQWRLMTMTPDELWAFIDTLELDEGFFDLLRLARERQAGLAILSDGLDFYVRRHMATRGVAICADDACLRSPDCLTCYANATTVTVAGVNITFPYANDCGQCGNCKAEHLFRLRRGFARTIYIGDGHSDLCAARYADVLFAKDALAEDCRQAGRPFIPFHSFAEILRTIR